MVKEDIIGGLILAIKKGENLEQAMVSFLNAGYKNKDIQDAARILQSSPDTPIPAQKPIFKKLSPFNLFNKQAQQIPTNKPLTPVSKTTKNLIQVQSISKQPTKSTPQSISLSQHLEGVEDPSKLLPTQKSVQQPSTPQSTILQPTPPTQESVQQSTISQPAPVQTPKPFNGTSLESRYESSKKSPRSIMIIILSILLFLLILSLGGVFLFRDSLIGLFNNLF